MQSHSRPPAVAIALMFGLVAACGSNPTATFDAPPGGTTPDAAVVVNGTPVTVHGTLVLPAGLSLHAGDLTVRGILDDSPVAADGSFSLTIPADVPSLAMAVDAAGKPILFGFLDSGYRSVSSNSTADALLFLGWGQFTAPASQARKLINGNDGTQAGIDLAAAIETALAANPHALVDGDAGITAVLTRVYAANARPIARRRAQLRRADDSGGAVTLSPTGAQSHVTLNASGTAVTAHSDRARAGVLLAYRTATVTNGTRTVVDPPAMAGEVEVPRPTHDAMGMLTHADSAPLALPLAAGTSSTEYRLVLLGPVLDQAAPAAIFGDVAFAGSYADWNARLADLQLDAFLTQFVAPLTGIIGFGSRYDYNIMDAADQRELLQSIVTPFALKTSSGFTQAYSAAMAGLAADDTLLDAYLRLLAPSVVVDVSAATPIGLGSVFTLDARIAKAKDFFKTFAGSQVIAKALAAAVNGGDADGVIKNFQASHDAETWTATVGTVDLTPHNPSITPDAPSVALTTSVAGGAPAGAMYHFTTSGNVGRLSTLSGGESATTVTTDQATIVYRVVPSDVTGGALDTVSVEVTTASGSLGTATTTVSGDVAPANPCLSFPAQDFQSPNMTITLNPSVAHPGDTVTADFTFHWEHPGAGGVGIQQYQVWLWPYISDNLIVDDHPILSSTNTTEGMGYNGQISARRVYFSDLTPGQPDDAVFVDNGATVGVGFTSLSMELTMQLPSPAPTGPDTHRVVFTVNDFAVPDGAVYCPYEILDFRNDTNWTANLILADFAESSRFKDGNASVAAFEVIAKP